MSKVAADVLDTVSKEFEEEVLKDLQDGQSQALALLKARREETLEAVAKIRQTCAKQAEALKRQIVGGAELGARNDQLEAMEKAVNDVFATAVTRITGVAQSRYEKCIARLIEEGVEAIGPEVTVLCAAKDKQVVASIVQAMNKRGLKLKVESKDRTSAGGVVLTSGDELVRFDNTFEARLERMRPDLRKEVAAILGGRQGPASKHY